VFLASAAFLLVGSIVRQINLLTLLSAMMGAAVAVNALVVRWVVKGLVARRTAPASVHAGERFTLEVAVENPRSWFRAWNILVQETLKMKRTAEAPAPWRPQVLFEWVLPRQVRRLSCRGTLFERGRYSLGPMVLTSRFPFGLVKSSVQFDQPAEMVVYPRLGRLTARWAALFHRADLVRAEPQKAHAMLEGEFHSMRHWRSGDSRKWIHWRTSARQGELMVRQFEQPLRQDLVLIVNLTLPEKPSLSDRENVELAVSFAATAANDVCRRGGGHLTLGIAGKEPVWLAGPASLRHLQDALEHLAVAQPGKSDSLVSLFKQSSRVWRVGSQPVLISTRSVNPEEWEAFPAFEQQRRVTGRTAQLVSIDVSQPALSAYYDPPQDPLPAEKSR
jgi:uncharacterized protein (DUF58 family)